MGMSKHTVGPWLIGRGADGLPIVHTSPDVHGPSGQGVAHVCKRPMTQDHEANARLIAAAPRLKDALAAMLDFWGGYECPEVDAAIAVMQELGEDRWSMQAQIEAAKAEGGAS